MVGGSTGVSVINPTFAIDPESFEQVGCIHTTQGLEFDYCGIIIGQNLRYEGGQVITNQKKEAVSDKSSGMITLPGFGDSSQLVDGGYTHGSGCSVVKIYHFSSSPFFLSPE